MRLAHFSDIHVTAAPHARSARRLGSKRIVGALNYYLGGRRIHFARAEHRIRQLLEDVEAQGVDHVLCTGDVTQMSYPAEFERCADCFGARLADPARYTVIPGNHDRYTAGATEARRFESYFGAVAPSPESYPFRKDLADGVTLVLVDCARPTGLTDSSGLCGQDQLDRLRALLRGSDLVDRFVVVALHYALLRANGKPDRRRHGIADVAELLAVIDAPEAHVDLVVHGHIHRAYTVRTQRRTVMCAGSATDLHWGCGYNIYTVEPERKLFSVERRVWSPAADRFVPR